MRYTPRFIGERVRDVVVETEPVPAQARPRLCARTEWPRYPSSPPRRPDCRDRRRVREQRRGPLTVWIFAMTAALSGRLGIRRSTSSAGYNSCGGRRSRVLAREESGNRTTEPEVRQRVGVRWGVRAERLRRVMKLRDHSSSSSRLRACRCREVRAANGAGEGSFARRAAMRPTVRCAQVLGAAGQSDRAEWCKPRDLQIGFNLVRNRLDFDEATAAEG